MSPPRRSIDLTGYYSPLLATLSLALCVGMLAAMGATELLPSTLQKGWVFKGAIAVGFLYVVLSTIQHVGQLIATDVSFGVDRWGVSRIADDERVFVFSRLRAFRMWGWRHHRWLALRVVKGEKARAAWPPAFVRSPERTRWVFVWLSLKDLSDEDQAWVEAGLAWVNGQWPRAQVTATEEGR